MTSAPAKFNFDLDFSGKERQTKVMTESGIAALRNEAHEKGLAEGRMEGERSELARTEAGLTAAAENIARTATTLLGSLAASDKQSRTEGIGLARAIGLKLAATLVARQPEAELDTLIEECLSSLERAPHLVIRCQPDLADRLREITETHMTAAGFSGRLIVLGDPEIGLGDGRLEWADGGIVRDIDTILAEIDKSIAAYCAASGLPAPVMTPNPLAETDHE